jgi:N-acetylmuramoyl-L-alanine amidase
MKAFLRISCSALIMVMAISLSAGRANAGPPPAEAAYQKARRAFYTFKENTQKQKFRHNWKKVAGKFEKVAKDFPKSSRAADALYTAGRMYHDLYLISRLTEDLDYSVKLLRQLVERFPTNHLADDAQLQIALRWIEFHKQPEKARAELIFLVDNFPDGDVTPKARRMLEDLGGTEDSAAGKAKTGDPIGAKIAEKTAGKDPKKKSTKAATSKPIKKSSKPKKEIPILESIKHWSNPGYTRIALYTRVKTPYKVGKLAADKKSGSPPRLYIDLMKTEMGDELSSTIPVADSIVGRIRLAERDEGFIRVVIDLKGDLTHRVFPLSNPDRVVVDISAAEDAVARVIGSKVPKKRPKVPTKKKVASMKSKSKPGVSLSMMAGLKVKTIVIDPGHGGKDPGAIGPKGTLEKNLTLDVAKRLRKLLKEKLKLEVVLTREKDRFVPLEGRTAFANKRNADLFISIHFNAHTIRKFRGVETFYLDLTNDRYSIKLAARENATSEKSISDLKYILADLALKSHVDDSISLSKLIQKSMVGTLRRKYKHVRDLGIKPALFYVLIGARMPSILVEGSFITNPTEEGRLKTKTYRQKIAEGIFNGIKNFINERDRLLDPEK